MVACVLSDQGVLIGVVCPQLAGCHGIRGPRLLRCMLMRLRDRVAEKWAFRNPVLANKAHGIGFLYIALFITF
jgi:hypothetical protein